MDSSPFSLVRDNGKIHVLCLSLEKEFGYDALLVSFFCRIENGHESWVIVGIAGGREDLVW